MIWPEAKPNLASPVLTLEIVLDLTQKNQPNRQLGSNTQVTVDGKALIHDRLAVQGGIFGPDGQNAGLVSGFEMMIPISSASPLASIHRPAAIAR